MDKLLRILVILGTLAVVGMIIALIFFFAFLFEASQNSNLFNKNESIECSFDSYNCEDFSTCDEAMNVFNQCGGSSNDVHRLDIEGDGIPCENLC